jgi:hypothetical protein
VAARVLAQAQVVAHAQQGADADVQQVVVAVAVAVAAVVRRCDVAERRTPPWSA